MRGRRPRSHVLRPPCTRAGLSALALLIGATSALASPGTAWAGETPPASVRAQATPAIVGAKAIPIGGATVVTLTVVGVPRTSPVSVAWGDGDTTVVTTTCTPARAASSPRLCARPLRHMYGTVGDYSLSAVAKGIGRPLLRMAVAVAAAGATADTPAGTPAEPWLQDMLTQVNAVRAKAGVGPLSLCRSLVTAAGDYAIVMAKASYFSHTGPDGSSPWDRMGRAGYTGWSSVAENIAAGQPDVAAVMDSWIHSPGHYANLIGRSFTQFGAGRATVQSSEFGTYWTQEFGAGGTC